RPGEDRLASGGKPAGGRREGEYARHREGDRQQEAGVGGRGERDALAATDLDPGPDGLAERPAQRRAGQQEPRDPGATRVPTGGEPAAACGDASGDRLPDIVEGDRRRVADPPVRG